MADYNGASADTSQGRRRKSSRQKKNVKWSKDFVEVPPPLGGTTPASVTHAGNTNGGKQNHISPTSTNKLTSMSITPDGGTDGRVQVCVLSISFLQLNWVNLERWYL